MRKIPARFAPVLFGALLSSIMVTVVSGVVLLLNKGLAEGFLTAWLQSFLTAWPVAFPTVLLVAPLVRKLVARLTG